MPGARKDSPNPVGHAGTGGRAGDALSGTHRARADWAGRRGGEGRLRGKGRPRTRGGITAEGSEAALPPRSAGVPSPLAAGDRTRVPTEGGRGAPASVPKAEGFRGPSTLTPPAGRARALHRLERSCLIPGSGSQLPPNHAASRDPQGPRKTESLSRVGLFETPQTVAPRLLSPWDSPDRNTGVGCPVLQRILLTQGWNLGLPHCRQTLHLLSHRESPGTQES